MGLMETIQKNITELLKEYRFDVKFYESATELEKYPKKMLYSLDKILLFLNEKRNPSITPDKEFFYIDIKSIDVNDGSIIPNEVLGKHAPSRARMVVHAGDIIISTCRPTRKAIAKIPPELDNQIASTGFCITKAKPQYNSDYILHILRNDDVAKQLDRFSSGTSYPAVLEKHIKKVMAPIPSFEKQESISDIWNNAINNRITKLENVNSLMNQLENYIRKILKIGSEQILDSRNYFVNIKSLFERMDVRFYNPKFEYCIDNLKKSCFKIVKLGDFLELCDTGTTPAKSQYCDEGYPIIKVATLKNNSIEWDNIENVSDKFFNKAKNKSLVKKDDILLLSSAHHLNYIGKKWAIVNDIPKEVGNKILFVGEIMRLRTNSNSLLPRFLNAYLSINEVQELINRMTRGQSAHLYPNDFENIPLILPPMNIQQEIIKMSNEISQKIIKLREDSLHLLDEAKKGMSTLLINN